MKIIKNNFFFEPFVCICTECTSKLEIEHAGELIIYGNQSLYFTCPCCGKESEVKKLDGEEKLTLLRTVRVFNGERR